MLRKVAVIGGILLIGGLGWGVYSFSNLPGEAATDQGREHWPREQLEKFVYNSHPPTSGPHDPEWIRPGIYQGPQDKYKLIHSLEHGYVIVHYHCPESECALALAVKDFASQTGLEKLIVVPDPQIDQPVVLTAWNRIFKMDSFDEKLAAKFVRAFRDRGPEATME